MKSKITSLQFVDNVVITDKAILSVCRLEPIDLSLLTSDEQKSFESSMRLMLSSIGEHSIQIIVRTRNLKPQDLQAHCTSLTHQDTLEINKSETRKGYIQSYIQELQNLIKENIIPIQEFYIVIPVDINPNDDKQLIAGLDTLEYLVSSITAHLHNARVRTSLLSKDDLNNLFEESLQINL